MPFSLEKLNLEHKPYNKCIVCEYLGVCCDGPNFLAMTPERRAEWITMRRLYLGWTLEYLSEKSGVSMGTLNNIVKHDRDVKISTLEAVVCALVNGSWGQYPCAMDSIRQDEGEWIAKCKAAEAQLADEQKKVVFLRDQVAFKEAQMLEKDGLLKDRREFLHRKDVAIYVLSACLIAAVITIAVLLS